MALPGSALHLAIGCVVLLAGCKPSVGDACVLHSDCSVTGDRLCDPTFPGGYCTQFNCEPGTCPSEAVCVAYHTEPSTKPECANTQSGQRFLRTFCMRSCASDGDCRTSERCGPAGTPCYACVDLSDATRNPWGAEVVERGAPSPRVCTQPARASSAPRAGRHDPSTEVCNPPADASFPPDLGGSTATDARPPDASDGAPRGAEAGP